MSSHDDDLRGMHPNRGTLAPTNSATEAQYRQEYELQIRRLSCPACGETPVAVPAALDAVPQLTPANCGH